MSDLDEEIVPVYNLAEFGEEILLLFPNTSDGRHMTPTTNISCLLPAEGTNYGSVDLSHAGTSGAANSSFTGTYEFMTDMSAWLFKAMLLIMYRLTCGAGNTVTVDVTAVLSYEDRPGHFTSFASQTRQATGITADEDGKAYFYWPVTELIPQHARVRIAITLASTRTAGAANSRIDALYNRADRERSFLEMHIHASKRHAAVVMAQEKIS